MCCVTSLFSVCTATLKAAGSDVHGLVGNIRQWISDAFRQSFCASAVECAGVILEVSTADSESTSRRRISADRGVAGHALQVFSSVPAQDEFLHDLLMDVTTTFTTAMENGVAPSNVPDVVYQYCRLVNKYVA